MPPNSRNGSSQTERWIIGAVFTLLGLFVCALGAGLIKLDPSALHAPLWVLFAVGLTFAMAGIMVVLDAIAPERRAPDSQPQSLWLGAARYILLLVIVGSFALVGTWVAFGPGERNFTSDIALPGLEISGTANDRIGRLVFGAGAILTWIFFIACAIDGARKLSSRHDNIPKS